MRPEASSHRSVCLRCGTELADSEAVGGCPRCLATALFTPYPPELPVSPATRAIRYFGDYELLEEISRGGMGVVYKARQVTLNRLVAVKMIRAGILASEADIYRFRTEAEAAGSLRHPHIVAIHEVGQHEGQHYFSMDLIEGKNLAELVREHLWPAERAAACVKTIAEAIHYAHQRGILHRDLKPSNVMVDAFGAPHITDFGLAKRMEEDSQLTASGAVLGTPSYMAPEQAAGKRATVGAASDVYSMGAILYELLTGRPPFQGETPLDTLKLVRETEPVSPSLLNSKVPRDLETICLKCLEKEPKRRYGSAQELADDLNRFLHHEPILARPSGPWDSARKWARRKPAIAALSAVVLLVTAAGLAGVLWQWQQAEAARRIAEAKARAETDAKAAAERERENAQRAHARATAALESLELQKAEELLREDKAATALAYFARMVRDNPSNHVTAERIMATLAQRSFVVPVATPPLTSSNQNDQARFSPDGRWMLRIAGNTVQVFEAGNYQRALRELDHGPSEKRLDINVSTTQRIISFHFSPDSRRVLTVSQGQGPTFRFWDLLTGQAIGNTIGDPPRDHVQFHEFSPDSRWFMTSLATVNPVVQLWETETGQPVFKKSFLGGRSPQFSLDGRRIFVKYPHGVYVWDYRTDQVTVQQIDTKGLPEILTSVLSSDGERLLTASWFAAQTWQLSTGRRLAEIPLGRSSISSGIEFSPDGQRVLVVADGTARIWDAATGQPLGESINGAAGVRSAQFAANGQQIITIGGEVRVWDGHTGLPVTEPIIPTDVIATFVNLSPNGRRVTTRIRRENLDEVSHWEIRLGYGGLESLDSASKAAGSSRTAASVNVAPNAPSSPLRVPAWLPELAEAVAGQRLSDKRVVQFLSRNMSGIGKEFFGVAR